MAAGVRASAIGPVSAALVTTLNVSALRTLCPGGVYRGIPKAQRPPYLSVWRSVEEDFDCFAKAFGSTVHSTLRIEISGDDPDGDARAATIVSKVRELLDDPSHLSVSGWTVYKLRHESTATEMVGYPDGATGYVATVTFEIVVRST